MQFGQLPAQGDLPVGTEGIPQIGQGGAQLVGSLVEDHGALLGFQGLQMFPPAFAVDGEEAFKGKPAGGKAADRQRVYRRAAAGDGEHLHIVLGAQAHSSSPGSEMAGVPASVTRAQDSPHSRRSKMACPAET